MKTTMIREAAKTAPILAALLYVGDLRADVSVSIVVPPAAPGEKTIASVNIQNGAGVAGARLLVSMPEFVIAGEPQTLAVGAGFEIAAQASSGRIALALARADGLAVSSSTLAQIPLLIPPDASPGEYPLQFEALAVCDAQPKLIPAHGVTGTLRVLAPPPDLDKDGLPDAWELSLFGSTAGTSGTDSDADGMTDLQEFKAGTNPQSAASVFRVLNVQKIGDSALLEWEGGVGHSFSVQWSDGPIGEDMTWHTVYSPDIHPTAAGASWIDDGTRTHGSPLNARERYYRISLAD